MNMHKLLHLYELHSIHARDKEKTSTVMKEIIRGNKFLNLI